MRRREFLGVVGGAAAGWPFAAWAQQAHKIPRVGFLLNVPSELVDALFRGLRDAGYIQGQNIILETRFAGNMLDRIDQFAIELVALHCDLIFAAGPYAIQALTKATRTIPLVAIDLESDPVANRWVTSIARPGGNLTGFFLDLPELGGKQIELMKEALPSLSRVAFLWDSTVGSVQFSATEVVARTTGVELLSLPIQRREDFKPAFDHAVSQQAHAVVVLSSPLIFGQRSHIAELAVNTRLPTISLFTLFPRSGGLMGYGPNFPDMWKRAATYVDRILRGARAGELPIERPSKFELVINLKTAKAIGLDMPPMLLARADEVLE
ncbi:MAG TPA: ABC transporter substrate-binding protein [Xanthobacteraceae bacterium]|nr:ABC transporter substrate-binding protein [Xanthobacteraceae bacterium]